MWIRPQCLEHSSPDETLKLENKFKVLLDKPQFIHKTLKIPNLVKENSQFFKSIIIS